MQENACAERKSQILTLEDRKKLTVSLVENVEVFQNNEVLLKTALGNLYIGGNGLTLEDLSIENGTVLLSGAIDRMDFSEVKEKRSVFKTLFK